MSKPRPGLVLLLILASAVLTTRTSAQCVNPGGSECFSALYLGETAGDQSEASLSVEGCGSGWFHLTIVENNQTAAPLSMLATLNCPTAGVDYALTAMDGCSSVIGSSDRPYWRRELLYLCWADTWGSDDSLELWLEVRMVAGSSDENWSLVVEGNAMAPQPIVDRGAWGVIKTRYR